MSLPDDAGPGATGRPAPTEYPKPLDLCVTPPGLPVTAKFGPALEWKQQGDGGWRIVISFSTNTPVGVCWRVLEPPEAEALLDWVRRSLWAMEGH